MSSYGDDEATGVARFIVTNLTGRAEYIAKSGGVSSNAIQVTAVSL